MDDFQIDLRDLKEGLTEMSFMLDDDFFGRLEGATLKRGRVNKARESVALAKTELQSFENELKALGDVGNIDLDADDFLEAADAFVGEDPFNAVSQNRLKQIKEAVQQAIGGVESMLEKL